MFVLPLRDPPIPTEALTGHPCPQGASEEAIHRIAGSGELLSMLSPYSPLRSSLNQRPTRSDERRAAMPAQPDLFTGTSRNRPCWMTRKVDQTPIADLALYANAIRTHNDKSITRLAEGIAEFGFIVPVVIDAQRRDHRRARPGRGRQAPRSQNSPDHLRGSPVSRHRSRPTALPTTGWPNCRAGTRRRSQIEFAELADLKLEGDHRLRPRRSPASTRRRSTSSSAGQEAQRPRRRKPSRNPIASKAGGHAAGRSLDPRSPPDLLRQCARGAELRHACSMGRLRAHGVHRSALQRAGQRPCPERQWPAPIASSPWPRARCRTASSAGSSRRSLAQLHRRARRRAASP